MSDVERRPYALVVDDDPFLQIDASTILEDAGFRTMEAENGDRGWQILTQHHASITLLFTDVQMPGSLNGFALARQVAASWPEIAIVVASGHLKPKAGENARRRYFYKQALQCGDDTRSSQTYATRRSKARAAKRMTEDSWQAEIRDRVRVKPSSAIAEFLPAPSGVVTTNLSA